MQLLDIFETICPKTFVWRKKDGGLEKRVEKKAAPKLPTRQKIVTKDAPHE